MKRAQYLEAESDIDTAFAAGTVTEMPRVYTVADLMALNVPTPSMTIDKLVPANSASLVVGESKAGKTILSVQMGIAVASGQALFGYYKVLEPGPVLVVETDDKRGAASVKDILVRSPIPVTSIPFYLVDRVPFSFGPAFIDWLKAEIRKLGLKVCILDSYTDLRACRKAGMDLVKVEKEDLSMLDELAAETQCTILIVHHGSKGSAALHWTQQAGGTYAMGAATESQIHVSRFADLDENAPERLIRIRGRHMTGQEILLRFQEKTLDYEQLLEGGGSSLYPVILQIQNAFGRDTFTPKTLCFATGMSRANAHRYINRLCRANVIRKSSYGEYSLEPLSETVSR